VSLLLSALRPHLGVATVVMACVLIVTGSALIGPWLVRAIVAAVTDGGGAAALNWIAAGLVATYAVKSLATAATFHFSHVVAFRTCRDLRDRLHAHLSTLSPAWFSARSSGDTVSRVVKDSLALEPLIADAVYGFVVSVLTALGILVILLILSPGLALLALLPMPLAAILVFRLGRRIQPAFDEEADREGDLTALTQDQVAGMREIQVFNREAAERARFAARSGRLTAAEIRARRLMAGFDPLVEGATGLSTAIVLLAGGRMVLSGSLPVEDLVAFLLYIVALYQPLYSAVEAAEAAQRGLASLRRIGEVLEERPAVADPPGAARIGRARGDLSFEGVGFAYGTGGRVLHDIRLSVPAGRTLAVVGPTGAGKSTLASLVARLHDPTDGRVTLDGQDLRDVALADVRTQVAMVLQDVFLFNGTVRENIRFGRPGASDDEVEEAARAAHAHDFIAALPQGYATEIGERGVRLSGGQKQRLSIARAILKDAPVLVLDEATSAVDTGTEALIQTSLNRLLQGRTVLVIAHRLSTVQNADAVAVLEGGRVVEYGAPGDLLQAGGVFARLVHGQAAA
jgi:ATP-binding cassette subfamily B protein